MGGRVQQPFKRLRLFVAAMNSIMQSSALKGNLAARQAALGEMAPYESRGKGRAGYQASHNKVGWDRRAARKRRNQLKHKRHAHGRAR